MNYPLSKEAVPHQENAYQMLQLKRPDVALYIYRQRILPRYQDK